MRIIATADQHLGFSRYSRTTDDGQNLRQSDVARQFEHFVDRAIEIAPDVILFAGDVFHQARPSNPVIVHAFSQFQRLKDELPNTVIVVCAGNHDLPRTNETCILQLLGKLGIWIVDRMPRAIEMPALDMNIMCVPETNHLDTPLAPNPAYRFNVLLIHGEIRGLIKGSRAPFVYEASELAAGGWDYVALGHWHEQQEIAPRVWYAGAIDYTTNDVWHEGKTKGFLEVDLETGAVYQHALPAPREHVNVELDGAGLSAETLSELIRDAAQNDFDDKVVRVVLLNVDNETKRAIDPRLIREFKARAVHFALENRAPEQARELIVGHVPRATSLESELRTKLETIAITDNIDRPEFIERGLKYFERTHTEAA